MPILKNDNQKANARVKIVGYESIYVHFFSLVPIMVTQLLLKSPLNTNKMADQDKRGELDGHEKIELEHFFFNGQSSIVYSISIDNRS